MGGRRNGSLRLTCLVSTLIAGMTCALQAQTSLVGLRKVAEARVPLDGREIAVPIPQEVRPDDLLVALRGTVLCSHNGVSYDGGDREYIGISPDGLELIDKDTTFHLYVFRFPAETLPPSVSAWVEIPRFVDELIVRPSQIRSSLSGDLRLEIWQAPRPGRGGLALLGALAALVILIGAVVYVWRPPAPDMGDVKESLRRIEETYRPAAAAVDEQRWDAGEVKSQLTRLRNGAHELGDHIGRLRQAGRPVDQTRLDEEIDRIEKQLEPADRDDVRKEIEATLETKRRLRDLIADTEANETRYLLRLSKIESAIEATRLWLAGQDSELADERIDAKAIEALNRELESLDEAIAELRILDDAQANHGGPVV